MGEGKGGTFDDDQEFRCIDTINQVYLEINDLLFLSSMQNLPACCTYVVLVLHGWIDSCEIIGVCEGDGNRRFFEKEDD